MAELWAASDPDKAAIDHGNTRDEARAARERGRQPAPASDAVGRGKIDVLCGPSKRRNE